MSIHALTLAFLSFGAPLARAQVTAKRETAPVASSGDAADDPAIWIHPTDPALSVVVATDKQGGLVVYDLAGSVIQSLPGGQPNNVDLRRGFPLGGERVTLVASADRSNDRLLLYELDAVTRHLRDVSARSITLGIHVYGCCMYRSPRSGHFFLFVTSKSGAVQQWRLHDDGTGKVDAVLVRAFDVGGQSEGCATDDELGSFFIGEEAVGLWRYAAEPQAGTARVSVDSTSGGHLVADVEGVAIYYSAGGLGYLVVSSQGDDSFTVYDRQPPHAFRTKFVVAPNNGAGIDGVSNCDGLDVTNLALGGAFPHGLLVVQDGVNPGANQNFKLVPWERVAAAASPPLPLDSVFDPDGSLQCGTPARQSYRDGANQRILTARSVPRMGTDWRVALDCAGHAPSVGAVFAFGRRANGIFVGAGELLVDVGSRRIFFARRPHPGGSVRFRLHIPNDASFCGLRAFVQGACFGAPSTELSNAIDMVMGI